MCPFHPFPSQALLVLPMLGGSDTAIQDDEKATTGLMSTSRALDS